MSDLHAIWLAAVQGFTEFLPISSSAHLILLPRLLGWPDQGLAFDVAVHVGSLSAILFYFHRDLIPMLRDWGLNIAGRPATQHSRMAWAVIIGTIPLGIGLAKTSIIAGRPWKFQLQYWNYVEGSDAFSTEHQIRLSINPVVSAPWNKDR